MVLPELHPEATTELIERLKAAAKAGKPHCWRMLATSELSDAARTIEQLRQTCNLLASLLAEAQAEVDELKALTPARAEQPAESIPPGVAKLFLRALESRKARKSSVNTG